MDLLNENKEQKNKKSSGQKTVLMLLIILIILTILTIALMIVINTKTKNGKTTLMINNMEQKVEKSMIIEDKSGVKYIALNYLCDMAGYAYENSDYETFEQDATKCYIQNGKQIYAFEGNSKIMYKYDEETKLDYQYYMLSNYILMNDNKLYISINDIITALNIRCEMYSKSGISIKTPQFLVNEYKSKLPDYNITEDNNNLKALAYGWIIASKNGQWGVLDERGNSILSFRYDNIWFNEYEQNYIVSKDGAYGVISVDGKTEYPLVYDEIQILNYENHLYKAKVNNKYGILNANGNKVGEIIYDEIGFPENAGNKIIYTLIIPEISGEENDFPETIVVKRNDRYGLIDIKTGKEILPCDHLEKLYARNDLGTVTYLIEAENQTLDLKTYLEIRNLI